ncbi:MAG TPA: hypothetical protein VL119_09195 [Acidimicrobiia bacterium]|nr:hypothetical protein [Acidimicrobiia bacterium]
MTVTAARRRIGAGVVAVALVTGAVVGVVALRHREPPPPSCTVSAGAGTPQYSLDIDQAENSTTIAAVGKRLGLPDHAVTVALAAALQESRLHNLPYGDRDSLGLFQQRPSQGWGTSAEILTPSYSAAAFFLALTRVSGWATLPVTEAAQEVQRSGAPTAYAQWEEEARTLAMALTGEKEAGLSCRFSLPRAQSPAPDFTSSMGNELGVTSLATNFATQRGWTVASWLVAHAEQFRLTSISFRGREWRASSGRWHNIARIDNRIRVLQRQT